MSRISLDSLLGRLVHPMGFPFPIGPKRGEANKIAEPFEENKRQLEPHNDFKGTPIVRVTDELLGRYEFMPVVINDGLKDYEIPNAIIMITGEKGIIETDVIDRGTVFEKVYERPYDISIIMTIIGEDKRWPAEQYKELSELYRGKRYEEQENKNINGRDIVTLRCALTNPFLTGKNNFLITRINILDNEGAENVEVIQIDGRSNVEFELIIK